jgi:hypothetical protein
MINESIRFTDMRAKAGNPDLEKASLTISSESLEEAKKAISIDCAEYLKWAKLLAERLKGISSDIDQKKFAKAMALTMLGYLPTKPITCPFCIQYSGDRTCKGCGYALTHGGRCDEETSAFKQFIEAFQDLGKAILQDHETHRLSLDAEERLQMLQKSINCSIMKAEQMIQDLPDASTNQLMEIKARYLDQMICLIPLCFFSDDVQNEYTNVRESLKNYW